MVRRERTTDESGGARSRPPGVDPDPSRFLRSSIRPLVDRRHWRLSRTGRPRFPLLPCGPLGDIVWSAAVVAAAPASGSHHQTVRRTRGSPPVRSRHEAPSVDRAASVSSRWTDASQITRSARASWAAASNTCCSLSAMWIRRHSSVAVFFSRVDRQRSGRPVGSCYICAAFPSPPGRPIRRASARPPVAVGTRPSS